VERTLPKTPLKYSEEKVPAGKGKISWGKNVSVELFLKEKKGTCLVEGKINFGKKRVLISSGRDSYFSQRKKILSVQGGGGRGS